MATQWEQALIATLRNAREILALCDQGRAGKVTAPEDARIGELCERIGYGAVMDSAQRQWELKDNIGCFTCGPCLATVKSILDDIDKVLLVFSEYEKWKEAEDHLSAAEDSYTAIGIAGSFALAHVIGPLRARFNSGERTDELHAMIMDIDI